jgi:D-alanine-D-alanine ligase
VTRKLRVGVLFGGRSAEHEVSLQSARNVIDAIDRERFEVVAIGIDKSGRWLLPELSRLLLDETDPRLVRLNTASDHVALVPTGSGRLVDVERGGSLGSVDVVLPILHGPFGEDGTVQGLLKLAGVPFVGSGVLGSAVGMDKDVMKRLLREAGLPVVDFRAFRQGAAIDLQNLVDTLGLPLFVKPANLGSSVGVGKARDTDELAAAIEEAFRFDTKILVEAFVEAREIECAVLGNDLPEASVLGEIVASHEFYSYEAKYIDEKGAQLIVPAELPEDDALRIRAMAIEAFRVLGCAGMARADFFYAGPGRILVNELNTIPGFTRISMYPRLWQASGVSYTALISRLIDLALERHTREERLETSY